jgi:hypothetical protein
MLELSIDSSHEYLPEKTFIVQKAAERLEMLPASATIHRQKPSPVSRFEIFHFRFTPQMNLGD